MSSSKANCLCSGYLRKETAVVLIVLPFVYHGLARYAVFLKISRWKKFLDGQWSEQTHGKRKVAQLKWKLLPSVDNQSIKSQIIFQTRAFASKHVEKCASYMQLNACQNLKSSIFTPSQCYLITFDPKGVKLKMKICSLNS